MFVPRMTEALSVGAPASNTVVAADFANVVDQEVWAISMDATVTMHGNTAGQGPCIVGVAHGDYTQAEIEEWLEANGSWVSSDQIANEKAKRKCRIIGNFDCQETTEKLNDGKPMRVKLGWKIQEGETLKLWAYNDSSAAFSTGKIIELKGPIYLKPL